MKKILFVCLAFILLSCSGCATIMTGPNQKVSVTSDPPGAQVKTDTGTYIETPGTVILNRNQDHTLAAEYQGCAPQQQRLNKGLQGWFFGNILFGGIPGMVIDLVSGSCDELKPKQVHFNFSQCMNKQNQPEDTKTSAKETSTKTMEEKLF